MTPASMKIEDVSLSVHAEDIDAVPEAATEAVLLVYDNGADLAGE